MNKTARIYTYSIIYAASLDFSDKVPFAVAVVEDEKDGKLMTLVEGYEDDMEIEIGMEVEFSRLNEEGNPIYRFANK